jgi:hypothetical protein
MFRYITVIILLLVSAGLYAQEQDTIRAVKHTHNAEHDSLGKKIVRQWSLSRDFTEEVKIPFDTVFSMFNRYRRTDQYSFANATLGNYGLPFYQINFFDRITDPDKFLYSYYYPLMYVPERAMFMNTQVPFTEIVWTYGTPATTAEQTFRVWHSQNVNRYFNLGLIYDIVYSLGQYNYQRSEDKDFTFYSSYTGEKYKAYFSAGINNITSYENGGITNASQLPQFDTREVQVNLGDPNKAKSELKNRNLLLVQRYTIGGISSTPADSAAPAKRGFLGLSGTFSHIFIWESNRRSYSDNSPRSGFYDTTFINRNITFDSLSSRIIKNTLRFDFLTDPTRKFRLGGGFGIRNELHRYSQIMPSSADTVITINQSSKVDTTYEFADTLSWKKNNNAIVGRLFNNIGDKFRWTATGELFLTGYRAGDLRVDGEIVKSFDWKRGRASWTIFGSMINRQPSFWYEQWGSNNFRWNNNFDKEFRIDLGTDFSFPGRSADLRFNYAIIDNYTDFGIDGMPSQHGGGLSVVALQIKKGLRAWKFHLDNDVLVQQSSNQDVLSLPLVTVRSAAFFEHLFIFESTNGRLNLQTGAEVFMHTPYHAYAYMPATGRFYRQDQVMTGNYPFINVFLNFKIQRTRAFIMFDHVNSGMMGYDYYMVPTYPMNIRMLRYGIGWTFYN